VKEHVIYALIDPRSDCLRYIGQATNVRKRLWRHMHPRSGDVTHRACWIRSLRAASLTPRVEVLEVVQGSSVNERERFYIALFRAMGADLVNRAEGGEGGPVRQGMRSSEETRARISRSHMGLRPTAETRAKLSASRRGKKQSEETIAKRVASRRGRSLSHETRAKISASLQGHGFTEEARIKMSLAAKARWERSRDEILASRRAG
jgi:hypothetical protein